jgi:hypothetical protein
MWINLQAMPDAFTTPFYRELKRRGFKWFRV